ERVTRAGVTEFRHQIHGPTGPVAIYTRRSSGTAASADSVRSRAARASTATGASTVVHTNGYTGNVGERVAGFEWEDGKRAKCTRHGVSIAEIEALFRGEVWVFPDISHSDRETRCLGIGRTAAGRHVFVAFTFRLRDGERWLRPISARFMHAKEVRYYKAEVARRQD
ncbi:MAG: BrnT family toxin, partial [Steroidobacteraceae bacterium]|nr:BrnT family toxin [Steroidobacteraceae bacterium]